MSQRTNFQSVQKKFHSLNRGSLTLFLAFVAEIQVEYSLSNEKKENIITFQLSIHNVATAQQFDLPES